ncbi:hypothetical protein [Undibacterium sp. Ren11W]|uniref:hypothetical protein n=1 Tax=Undibacterium sp. Ren11W TaxID=3413045 RepID=UPI003BF30F16
MNTDATALLLERTAGPPVLAALKELLARDTLLLEIDANERSIAYRLAMYLQAQLPELNVDCEYNRDGIDPKKIQHLGLYPDDDDTEAKTVFPDIIAHLRNTTTNYLVIELKKSTNTTDRLVDFAKLRGYKKNLGFQFALFLELATGGQADVSSVVWVDA